MLERTALRQSVVSMLKGVTGAGDKVYDSRVTPWDAEELPGISVVTPSERGVSKAVSQIPVFDNTLTLNIEVAVASTDDWAECMDVICEEVEEAVLKNAEFLEEFSHISNYSTTLDYKDGGTMPIVVAVMSLDLNYTMTYEPLHENVPFKIAFVDFMNGIKARIEIKGE